MEADPSDPQSSIPHGQHLTWTDVMRSKFHPIIDRADTGEVTYPRRDFLVNAASTRKKAADDLARKARGG